MSVRGAMAALAVASVLVLAPVGAARADSLAYEGVIGAGAAISTFVYSPLKVLYAAGGLGLSTVTLLWTMGDVSVAGPIFTQSVGGDYVVTPSHLDGSRELTFFGS